ncbi:hypothetical protein HJC23_000769 [Cyclotella cryptica]|uniref:Uncharacterized protein n=1 Tax=Cyclotella cryptica TaxID=29204 RepID=A0ABD3PYY0_9STRA
MYLNRRKLMNDPILEMASPEAFCKAFAYVCCFEDRRPIDPVSRFPTNRRKRRVNPMGSPITPFVSF